MINAFYDLLNKIGYDHPVHPTEVHMPIGLIVGAFIFAAIAFIFRRQKLALVPQSCLILAFIWLFPTMILGLMDWQHFYAGGWILPIKIKLVTALVLLVLLALSIFLGRKFGAASAKVLPVYLLCVVAVVILGYYGGQLTFGGMTIEGPPAYRAGQDIYAVSCAACHPSGGNVIDPSKPLINSPLLANQQTMQFWLNHPASPMPAFQEMPPAKVKELYDYIANVLMKPPSQVQ